MPKNQKTKLFLSSIITLIPIPIGLFLWNKLPEQVATHWDFNGVPNGWSSKEFAVFGLPLFLLAVHWICIIGTKADPKAATHPEKIMSLIFWTCPVVSLFCNGSVYAEALGYPVSINNFGAILVGITFIILGNYIPKCPHNYTVGIKIPWTLNSEENWNQTHRFAGPVWVICGLLFMVFTFLRCQMLSIILIFAATLVPMIYSYVYYKKHENK